MAKVLVRRKNLAKAFTLAKEYLWLGGETMPPGKFKFICFTLNHIYINELIDINAFIQTKQLIQSRLDPFVTLEDWLNMEIGQPKVTKDTDGSCLRLQATRAAWLDSLIEEFSTS